MKEGERLLIEHASWFANIKSSFKPNEMAICYKIYNLLLGKNKSDTGCNSCRREIIGALRKEYNLLKNNIMNDKKQKKEREKKPIKRGGST